MENVQEGGPPPRATAEFPRDRRLELLANERRRYVVAYLRQADAPVSVDGLAKRIASREREVSAGDAGGVQDRVHHSLYHCHVPKLAAAGVVDHDRERDGVEPGPDFDDTVALLDALSSVDGGDTR